MTSGWGGAGHTACLLPSLLSSHPHPVAEPNWKPEEQGAFDVVYPGPPSGQRAEGRKADRGYRGASKTPTNVKWCNTMENIKLNVEFPDD